MSNLFSDIKNAALIAEGKIGHTKSTRALLEITRPVVSFVEVNGGFSYEVRLGNKFKWTRKLSVTNRQTAESKALEFTKWFDSKAKEIETGKYTPTKDGRPPFIMDEVSHLFFREPIAPSGFKG